MKLKNSMTGFLVGIMALALGSNCKGKTDTGAQQVSAPKTSTAAILFAVGDVTANGKKLSPGDIISEGEIVKTGKKSSCDLQIRESESEPIIRLKQESEFSLKTVPTQGMEHRQGVLKVGTALMNVSKKLKQNEKLEMSTPTTVAGVRGTKFEMNVTKDGSSRLNVWEGKVAARPRIAEVEDLPAEVQQKAPVLTAVVESAVASEQVLEPGTTISIKKADTDKILKDSGVSEVLKKVKIEVKPVMSPEEIKKAIEDVEKAVEVSEKKEQMKKKQEIDLQKKIEKIKAKEMEQKIKEYEELIAIEKKKLEDSTKSSAVVKERNQKEKAALMKRIEQVVGKSSETLVLKNGNKVSGVIFQDGSEYIVLTPDGKVTYPEADVEGMDL